MEKPISQSLRIFIILFSALLSILLFGSGSESDTFRQNNPSTEADSHIETQSEIPNAVEIVEEAHLNKIPVREISGLHLTKMGWIYQCMDCHTALEAKWHYERPMAEHQNITLNHGVNRFCLNCHHPENRNVYVDYDGSEIPAEAVVQLCGKCHGPTYRDWEAGVHGRRNGHWDPKKGKQTRLICIQCHDPHAPAFKAFKPMPPPSYPARAPGGKVPDDSTSTNKH